MRASVRLYRCSDETWDAAQVVAAAEFLGLALPLRERIAAGLAASTYADEEGYAAGSDHLQDALDAFRYGHDLLTEEETERWLDTWGVDLDDLTGFLDRRHWGERFRDIGAQLARDYAPAAQDVDRALWPEAVFDGAAREWAVACARRSAALRSCGGALPDAEAREAACGAFFTRTGRSPRTLSAWMRELGKDQAWFDLMVAREACARRVRDEALAGADLERELASRRMDFLRVTFERAAFPSAEAAREAMLCVTEDRESLADAARRAGVAAAGGTEFLGDIADPASRRLLSAVPGEVLGPLESEEGWELWKIVRKAEPDARDGAVRDRLERLVENAAFERLVGAHIAWLVEMG